MATTSVVAGVDTRVTVQSASTKTTTNANSTSSLYNEFITLMVAQVQNQDPLNPTDGTQYVTQLAQFAQVQSTDNMVSILNNNAIMMDNLQVLTTAGLVGQSVSVRTDTLHADGEGTYNGSIELTSSSNTVTLELVDEAGNVTRIPLGAQPEGTVDFSIDAEKLGLKGKYEMTVVVDEGQNYTPAITLEGTVQKVTVPSTGGASVLTIHGVGDIPFYEISSFGKKSEETNQENDV
ncbi:flagellar hook assembly protein FlgD [Vibrio sp. Vb2880]|uniref:flagellar hook capping FlgD N-terminal domain-containing protein n=1 Tax=Vibrio TaxID=662 RepID=UPI0011808966|nr:MULTISPECIES: flagellar hook capping FlgD N-terminal domain-containing protein [Vibrio]MBO0214099.1 flagellar hook assembly protein FlgD [Vibrio sp. Vb2880]MCG6211309.1 flagellar hook assembly protein FlgD [Vibrio furnissii]TRN26699.1 flagellar basal body rod modification protein [Vibrio furnissii]